MSTEDYEAFESMLSERLSVIEVDCREAKAEGRRALEAKDSVGMQLAKQTLQMKTLERRRVAAMLSVRGAAAWIPPAEIRGAWKGGRRKSVPPRPISPPSLSHSPPQSPPLQQSTRQQKSDLELSSYTKSYVDLMKKSGKKTANLSEKEATAAIAVMEKTISGTHVINEHLADHASESFESGEASVQSLTIGGESGNDMDLGALEALFSDGEATSARAPAEEPEIDLSLFPAVPGGPEASVKGAPKPEPSEPPSSTKTSSGLSFLMGN